MNYEDLGFNKYFEKDISTPQLPIEVIPDLSGPSVDRILESLPVDMILPTGSLKSEDGRVIFNLKEGYIAWLNDQDEEAVRIGKQNDGTFGFFFKKHTGDEFIDEEGIKDISLARRTDIVTPKPDIPFQLFRKFDEVWKRGGKTNSWSGWKKFPNVNIDFSTTGKTLCLGISYVKGWTSGHWLFMKYIIDDTFIQPYVEMGLTGGRTTHPIITPFTVEKGSHTARIEILGSAGSSNYFQVEILYNFLVVFGK